jgi:hypothetical protein
LGYLGNNYVRAADAALFLEGVNMAIETSVILRSLLLQAKKATSAKEIEMAIEALCTKEDIDAVNQSLEKLKNGSD